MTVEFIVPGDPVPYKRMTQGQVKVMRMPRHKMRDTKLRDSLERYFKWREFVRLCSMSVKFNRAPKDKIRLDVMIYFRNRKHGDPENVRKGIQDALFEQDKYVIGCYDYGYEKNSPRCEITITEGVE